MSTRNISRLKNLWSNEEVEAEEEEEDPLEEPKSMMQELAEHRVELMLLDLEIAQLKSRKEKVEQKIKAIQYLLEVSRNTESPLMAVVARKESEQAPLEAGTSSNHP